MTRFPAARQSDENPHADVSLWRPPAVLPAAVVCLAVAVLLATATLSPAAAAETDADAPPPTVSESPSDVRPPAPEPSAPKAPAAEAPETCGPSSCRATCCRRSRLGGRLLRRLRLRRCYYRVHVPCKSEPAEKADPYAWKELFDGKTLGSWKVPKFGGEGKVYVKDGMIVMEMGESMTGIAWGGELPRDSYELQYEGIRLEGVDFFATVTFPVAKDYCSLVTGGWGGTVVGLSCIDYYDAGDNLTTRFHDFKDKQWYKFRVRVTPAKIQAWIGDEQLVDQERAGHKIDIRMECDLCRPLGFASYCTTGAVRNIRIRKLKPSEIEQPQKEP